MSSQRRGKLLQLGEGYELCLKDKGGCDNEITCKRAFLGQKKKYNQNYGNEQARVSKVQ